jgi:hypothetical protein
MTDTFLATKPWVRFHDSPATPIRPVAAEIHCVGSLADIKAVCASATKNTRFSVAGSHWGLSEAAVSDVSFIEMNWPGPEAVARHEGLDIDFGKLIDPTFQNFLAQNPPTSPDQQTSDPCLASANQCFFVHVKSGTRIFQAYQLLDQASFGPGTLANDLGPKYRIPWAFETLGGAGGQTVFGALTTGTHGGDYYQNPISDSVVALHLVAAGGQSYWVEPSSGPVPAATGQPITGAALPAAMYPITVDAKLKTEFGANIQIIRDTALFNAIIVSAGRFGVVASVVLRVVPQYCLQQHRVLDNWSNIKNILKNSPKHHKFFDSAYFSGGGEGLGPFEARFGSPQQFKNRFLQISVNTSPHAQNENRCGVTQRWFAPHSGPESKDASGALCGRFERGTEATAGKSYPYHPPKAGEQNQGQVVTGGTFLQKACSKADFIPGLLQEAIKELGQIQLNQSVPLDSIALIALGAELLLPGLLPTVAAMAALCAAMTALAAATEAAKLAATGQTLGSALNTVFNEIFALPFPVTKEQKLQLIRAIFLMVFEMEEGPQDYVAISYSVMDTHDYFDVACRGNVKSIEVFFDADKPDVYCAYIDHILAFEVQQQFAHERVMGGYISLRFIQGSRAQMAPARFTNTVVVEVAGLMDIDGSLPFVLNAAAVARHPVFNAAFHWGQHNPMVEPEVAARFGPRLTDWRNQLKTVYPLGSPLKDAFSNAFTRRTGLEPL